MNVDNPLGRIKLHDPQSRNHQVRLTPIEGRNIWHPMNALHVDQFYTGGCVGFSATNMLNCSAAWRSRVKFNDLIRYGRAGRTYLGHDDGLENYHQATVYDPFDWIYPPTDEGSSAIGVMKWWHQAGIITGYDWAFGFQAFLSGLQRQPILVGTEWFEDMFQPDRLYRVAPTGPSVGGHEYLATQVNWTTRYIGFENSWGESWGKGGRFYISFDNFEQLLANDGDAVAPRFL